MTNAAGAKGYLLFDADNHCYDQPDAFTRYIDPAYRDDAIHTVRDPETGTLAVYAGKTRITWVDSSQGPDDTVRPPGSLKEFLKKLSTAQADGNYGWEPKRPEYLYREPRLKLMDEQGVESVLLFSESVVSAEICYEDPRPLYANMHAFNRWLDEEWGFDHEGRIFSPPYISLKDLDLAVAEVEYVIDKGARLVSMAAGPAYGRSVGDPYFDPVWARLNEAGVGVAYHIGDSGYNKTVGVLWGQDPDAPAYQQSAWQWTHTMCDRPIMETLSALVFDNIFGRFPNLQVVAVEFGCAWVPYLLERMDKMRGMGRNGPWIGGQLDRRPSEIFAEHVLVTPFPEDNVQKVADQIGVDSLVLGSDYPHAEGCAQPSDFYERLSGLSEADQRKIMRDNGRRLVGLK